MTNQTHPKDLSEMVQHAKVAIDRRNFSIKGPKVRVKTKLVESMDRVFEVRLPELYFDVMATRAVAAPVFEGDTLADNRGLRFKPMKRKWGMDPPAYTNSHDFEIAFALSIYDLKVL